MFLAARAVVRVCVGGLGGVCYDKEREREREREREMKLGGLAECNW